MKNLLYIIIIAFCTFNIGFSKDLLYDTNTVKYEELNLGILPYVHTKIADNKWVIYGVGLYSQEQSFNSKHIITEIEYDKATDKVKINSANQIEPLKGVNFNPIFSENTKMNYNQDNGEISVIRAQALFTNLKSGNILRYVPMREVFKDYKLIRSEYDSTFKYIITIKPAKIVYNDDSSVSIYTHDANKAWDSVGIYKLNYNSDFTFRNFEFIPMPSIVEVKAKSGIDFTDTVLFYEIEAINKTNDGTLFKFKFPYNYIKPNGKKGFDMANWYMFIDNNNKLQYIIRPETLVEGEQHNLSNTIIEYKDYFVFTTNMPASESKIFSNALFFIDKKTGKVIKRQNFGLDRYFLTGTIAINNGYLYLVGYYGANENYSAGLSIYDLKYDMFISNSNIGTCFNKKTTLFNMIQLNENTMYLYGTLNYSNFFGVKYKFVGSGVDISTSDNTNLKINGELNRISLTVSSEETTLGETNIEVYNITGKLLYSGKHKLSNSIPLEIYDPAFVNGVYFVRVSNAAIDISGKINI